MLKSDIWSRIKYLLLNIVIVGIHVYLLEVNMEETHIIKNGETVYAIISKRYCTYRSSIDVYYRGIKAIIHLPKETCLSDTCAEGNLYPVKYMAGQNRLVAPWKNVRFYSVFLSVNLFVFTSFTTWIILYFILMLFPNRFRKFRKFYYKLD